MKKLLIAEKSEVLTAALLRRLRRKFEIHTCSRGDIAMALMDTLQPDVLFIDLTLPQLDGLAVLERSCFSPAVCIARTSVLSDEVLLAAQNAGVKYIFSIPCRIDLLAGCIEQYR